MTKLLILGGLLVVISGAFLFVYKEGVNKGIISETKKQLKIEIIKQNEIIETKKFQQELISKTVSNDSVINRRKWLQLVYSKRKNSHGK